jgi:hypothetical protein
MESGEQSTVTLDVKSLLLVITSLLCRHWSHNGNTFKVPCIDYACETPYLVNTYVRLSATAKIVTWTPKCSRYCVEIANGDCLKVKPDTTTEIVWAVSQLKTTVGYWHRKWAMSETVAGYQSEIVNSDNYGINWQELSYKSRHYGPEVNIALNAAWIKRKPAFIWNFVWFRECTEYQWKIVSNKRKLLNNNSMENSPLEFLWISVHELWFCSVLRLLKFIWKCTFQSQMGKS